jgi:hypothetical protein
VGVNVFWRDEQGTDLGQVLDPQMSFSSYVQSTGRSETNCLRFIDPYGNTVFNQSQIPVLIRELESRMATADPGMQQQISSVIRLLKKAERQIHTYAWFIGD